MAVTNRQAKVVARANADTQNFQFVVRANILDNGDLDIGISSNLGFTYYTDNISMSTEVPEDMTELMYTAKKDVVAEYGRRQLVLVVGTVLTVIGVLAVVMYVAIVAANGYGLYCLGDAINLWSDRL